VTINRRDVLLAVVVGAAQIGFTFVAARSDTGARDYDVWAALLLAIGPAALVVRRRYPVAVLLAAFAGTLAYAVIGYGHGPIFLSLIVAYVNAVMAGRRRFAWALLPVGFVAFQWLPTLAGNEDAPPVAAVVGVAAWLLVLAGGTELVLSRRRSAAEEARARAAEAQRRATEERLRIAREVHDVVAHNISLINVQAGVALHLIDEQPDQARPALAAIKEASKETLEELRSVVDALRSDGEAAPRAPTPGLDDIDRLATRTSEAGLPVRVDVSGMPRPVPAGVDLAAYRIVQEALTNATRHAGATQVIVRLVHGENDLTVEVADDGRGAASSHVDNGGAGSGITGMRERVTALGGTFEAGPRPGRGFAVHARLPLGGVA
jgi:signal transduction histidine kinase